MYVCICNGFRECEVRALARQGLRSVPAIYRALGARVQCGRCLPLARRIVEDGRNGPAMAPAASSAPIAPGI